MEILEYLKTNKEWLFSGIGITIPGLIIGGIRIFYLNRRVKKLEIQINQSIGNNSSNNTQVGRDYISGS